MKGLLLLLLLLAQPAFGETRDERIRGILSDAKNYSWDLEMVTPDIRDELIVQLRGRMTDGDLQHWGPSCRALIRIGDEQTIAKAMHALEQSPERKTLLDTDLPILQPLLIPYLAKDFFRDDGEDITLEPVGGDALYDSAPVSIAHAYRALEIVQKSPAFSPEVKAWAVEVAKKTLVHKSSDERRKSRINLREDRNLYREDSVREFRDMMRQWWRDNERHFKAKNYGAVKPAGASYYTNPWILPAAIGLLLLSIGARVIVIVWRRDASRIAKSATEV